jgi:BASS family bile acid:Na+ symporter
MNADQLNLLINLLATATLFELMVAIGLGVTLAEVFAVARNWRLVVRAALANYVCVPATAMVLLLLFQPHSLEPEQFPLVAAGFLIAAVCPGAPYGPPFTGMAKGDVVVSVGLMVLLAGSSALVAPLLLHWLLPLMAGDQKVQVDAMGVIGTLICSQFLPLCLGLAVRQWRPALADRLKKPASLLSIVLNLLMLGGIFTVQFQMLIGIPWRAFVGMFALVVASVCVGWLLGGPGSASRKAMAMATSVRNVGVSLVIATASFPGTQAVTAATAFALFQTIVMALAALGWGRLSPERTDVPSSSVDIAGEPAPPGAIPAPRASITPHY